MKKKASKNRPENVNKSRLLSNATNRSSNLEHHISNTNGYTVEESLKTLSSCLYENYLEFKQRDYEK